MDSLAQSLIDDFRRDGVVLLRGLFRDWVEPLRQGVAANMAEPSAGARIYPNEDGSAQFFGDYCNWQRIPQYRDFVLHGPAARIAGQLMGAEEVRIFHEHVLVKEPGAATATPWHHDQPYYCVEARQTCSLWLALDPVARETSVEYVAGSHRWGQWFRPERFNKTALHEGDGLPPVPDIEAERDRYDIRGFTLEPGDAIAFSFLTLHGAPPNRSAKVSRRAFSTRWVGDDARFVWSALVVLFALIMVAAGGFSLIVLARRAGGRKGPFVAGLVIATALLAVFAWFLGPMDLAARIAEPCGPSRTGETDSTLFLIIPYMGRVFCQVYEPTFVAFFFSFFSVAGPLQMAISVLFYGAAISLIIDPRPIAQVSTEDLARRLADFRVLLVLASAMLTLTGLMELTLWGWLAEIAEGWDHAARLRDLQVGSALYWGICNSALLVLIFAPLGSLLAKRARALSRRENDGASLTALEAWEREQGVSLLGRWAWPQVIGLLAPLLTGAVAFLFQSAVGQ